MKKRVNVALILGLIYVAIPVLLLVSKVGKPYCLEPKIGTWEDAVMIALMFGGVFVMGYLAGEEGKE